MPALTRGWCNTHYGRFWRNGDPLGISSRKRGFVRVPDAERFFRYVNVGENRECWIWAGGINPNGYGFFNILDEGKRTTRPAHRFMYGVVHGEIPEGLEIDHLCRVRACVNVGHLEAVTHAENVRRANLVTALHCPTCRCREC